MRILALLLPFFTITPVVFANEFDCVAIHQHSFVTHISSTDFFSWTTRGLFVDIEGSVYKYKKPSEGACETKKIGSIDTLELENLKILINSWTKYTPSVGENCHTDGVSNTQVRKSDGSVSSISMYDHCADYSDEPNNNKVLREKLLEYFKAWSTL